MNTEEFNQLLDDSLDRVRRILAGKAEEYAIDTNRMHNFEIAAGLQRCTNAQALGGMLAKHIVSVYDMINDTGVVDHPMAQWDEKIFDAINYLILLRAVITEDKKEQANHGKSSNL